MHYVIHLYGLSICMWLHDHTYVQLLFLSILATEVCVIICFTFLQCLWPLQFFEAQGPPQAWGPIDRLPTLPTVKASSVINYHLKGEVFIVFCFQLHSVTWQYESTIIWKIYENYEWFPLQNVTSWINYHLKDETSIKLRSTCYTAVWINWTAIKVATMKITDNLHYKRKPFCATN